MFGDYSPAGRLPVTFYKSDSDLPPFEDYSMQNRTYRYFKGEALYPFGFGLSYTKFIYSNLKLSKKAITKNESVDAEVTVTNAGKFKSDEVVQLYLAHEDAGIASPLYSLKGFKRISLAPGASTVVKFTINPDMLSLINDDGKSVGLPGKIKIRIAGSLPCKRSEDLGAAKHLETTIIMNND